MENLISLCKRRGFIYQGSEIYGGLAGTWDYGPLGVALKKNIENLWWKRFVLDREDMYGIDAALLMNPNVWVSSGHVAGFSDPLVEDLKTKKRYRADHLLEANNIDPKGMKLNDMDAAIKEKGIKSPDENPLGDVRQFNMMFKTTIGAMEDADSISYLRPETAQGMFVNFKNVLDSFHPKLPFGLAQIGKAFRNEIAPRDFIFRVRELEQMEIEYFVKPEEWEDHFEKFRKQVWEYTKDVGLPQEKVHELEVASEDRAHYSKRTIDFEFDFPFGKKELYGLAYRTDYDLKQHSDGSKVDLSYFDEETKSRFIPHCIEPSFGVGRTLLAVLSSAYTEDELGGEKRAFLKLSPKVAPYLAAVFPLLKNKPELVDKAREVFTMLRKNAEFGGRIAFDDNGNIGKRYRRQDEIGTPFCITIDFDTLGENPEHKDTVTLRNRDTGEQERVAIKDLLNKLV
jgi:glycyl-tRNA synthetase